MPTNLTPEQREQLLSKYRKQSVEDAVTLLRETTDLNDEQIYDELAMFSSEEEEQMLVEYLGVE